MKTLNRATYNAQLINEYYRIGSIIPSFTIILFLLAAMCIDFLFQYPANEALFTEALFLSVFNALAFAFAIDALPLIMSNSLLNLFDNPNSRAKYIALFTVTFIAFLIIFSLSVALKLSLMEVLFDGAEALTSSASIATQTTTYEPSNAEIAMILIQCSVQLATSVFLFAISIQTSLADQRAAFIATLQAYLHEENLRIDAQIEKLHNIAGINRDQIVIEKHKETDALIDKQTALQKRQVRTALAMRLKNTTASSNLLDN